MSFASTPQTQRVPTKWVAPLLLVPFAASGLVDLPRLLHIGPISLLGAVSVGEVATAGVALVMLGGLSRRVFSLVFAWTCLLLWLTVRSLFDWPDQNGFQNAFVYVLFGANALVAGTFAAAAPGAVMRVFQRGVLILDVLALTLTAANFALFGLPTESGADLTWLVGPRAVALLAITPTGWHLARWAHGKPGSGVRAVLWIVTVMASLSRTATAVVLVAAALSFFAQAWTMPGRLVRQLPFVGLGAGAMVVLVLIYQTQFHARFLEGYNTVAVAGVEISTSGRDNIWPVVIASALTHPIIGGGLGSSQAALAEFDRENVGHPHNDYLRIWHDGGVIGLLFLLLAFGRWLTVLSRQWFQAVRLTRPFQEVHLAALLTLIGILLAALTDNGFVYAYLMGPAGLLAGAAFGIGVAQESYAEASAVPAAAEFGASHEVFA